MTGIRVHVNGSRLCIAGLDRPGVLTAILTLQLREGQPDELDLAVGGYFKDDDGAGVHMDWAKSQVRVGGAIDINIEDVSVIDAPSERREAPDLDRNQKEAYFERLKNELGK